MTKRIDVELKGNLVDQILRIAEGRVKISGIYDGIINFNLNPWQGFSLISRETIMAPHHLMVHPFPDWIDNPELEVKVDQKGIILPDRTVLDWREARYWNGNLQDKVIIEPGTAGSLIEKRLEQMQEYLNQLGNTEGLARLKNYWSLIFNKVEEKVADRESILLKQIIEYLQQFMNSDDFSKKIRILHKLIGAGIGLTPSGDDFLVGFLSVLYFLASPDLSRIHLLDCAENYQRTTRVSAVALRGAVNGSFNERIIGLYQSFYESDYQFKEALRKLGRIGSTSGQDMITGIIFGFLYKLHNKQEVFQ